MEQTAKKVLVKQCADIWHVEHWGDAPNLLLSKAHRSHGMKLLSLWKVVHRVNVALVTEHVSFHCRRSFLAFFCSIFFFDLFFFFFFFPFFSSSSSSTSLLQFTLFNHLSLSRIPTFLGAHTSWFTRRSCCNSKRSRAEYSLVTCMPISVEFSLVVAGLKKSSSPMFPRVLMIYVHTL